MLLIRKTILSARLPGDIRISSSGFKMVRFFPQSGTPIRVEWHEPMNPEI
jgi:hypothetical protein